MNKPAVPVIEAETCVDVIVPEAEETWHPVAKKWFESLARSGQAAFYTDSDWGLALVAAEALSRELHPKPHGMPVPVLMEGPITGASFSAFLRACSMLLVSEADRRRVSLELQRPKAAEEVPDVSELARYRQRLQSG